MKETQEPVGGMKLLIDFINNFRADKKLKYSIACNVQAYLARFGVDISDNVRQKFQDDKCAEDLVDEVLDDMLNKVYEAPPTAPIKTEGKDEIPNAPNCYNLYESFIWQDGFKAGYAASKSSAEKAIGERKFTLKEVFEVFQAGYNLGEQNTKFNLSLSFDNITAKGPKEYFKDKFGIEI